MIAARKTRDQPWLMRTYSGHSSAKASNALYRTNLAKGQTGLPVAFDLPTQTGYDADSPHARGEVGKVGVPISHIEDMDQLFDQIPLDQMNTSMTINATAAWLLSLYIGLAQRRGIDPRQLSGTTQNDIIKEYLSRGTYVFPPGPSMRLLTDVVTYAVREIPQIEFACGDALTVLPFPTPSFLLQLYSVPTTLRTWTQRGQSSGAKMRVCRQTACGNGKQPKAPRQPNT